MKIDVSLTEKSIQDAIDKLERYKDRLQDKCIAFVGELASNGIAVARANTGNFGHYITFSYEIKDTTDGCTAIVLATETGQIQSTWQTADGLKTVDVSPLLMAEYGSGWKAKPHFNDTRGGQGTFPGQTHAYEDMWWYWDEKTQEWKPTHGVKATMPMYSADMEIIQNVAKAAKEVFGE